VHAGSKFQAAGEELRVRRITEPVGRDARILQGAHHLNPPDLNAAKPSNLTAEDTVEKCVVSRGKKGDVLGTAFRVDGVDTNPPDPRKLRT
jgi:hypothetical protein